MDKTAIVTAAISVLSVVISSGLIQFFVTRHDSKNKLIAQIQETQTQQFALLIKRQDETDAKIDNIEAAFKAEMEVKGAKEARYRILRFGDECRANTKHSEEMFNNVLDDITTYNYYCHTHPNFENEKTKLAEQYIKQIYTHCVDTNDFL